MENLLSKSVKAAATLLERKDYEVLDRGWEPGCIPGSGIVALDGDTLVFVGVRAREGAEGGLPEMPGAFRKRAEEAAARWLATNGDRVGDVRVRFDESAPDPLTRGLPFRHDFRNGETEAERWDIRRRSTRRSSSSRR